MCLHFVPRAPVKLRMGAATHRWCSTGSDKIIFASLRESRNLFVAIGGGGDTELYGTHMETTAIVPSVADAGSSRNDVPTYQHHPEHRQLSVRRWLFALNQQRTTHNGSLYIGIQHPKNRGSSGPMLGGTSTGSNLLLTSVFAVCDWWAHSKDSRSTAQSLRTAVVRPKVLHFLLLVQKCLVA